MVEKFIKLLKDNGLTVAIKDWDDIKTTTFFLFSDNKRVWSFSAMDTNYFVLWVRTPPSTKDKSEWYCSYLWDGKLDINDFIKTLSPHKYLSRKLIWEIYKDTGFYNNLEECEKNSGKLIYL